MLVSDTAVRRRFAAKVVWGPGCWEWSGYRCPKQGYGYIAVDGSKLRAHRVSAMLYKGGIPQGACVCHHCDNPSCVRPSHLFFGTRSDNMYDMYAKNRHRRGSGLVGPRHPMSKVSHKKAAEIFKLSSLGLSSYQIAQSVGVSRGTVSRILRGDHWTSRVN